MSRAIRSRLLLSSCLTGLVCALSASPADAQNHPSAWQARADLQAHVGEARDELAVEMFAPLAQNERGLLFGSLRLGNSERFEQSASVVLGARAMVGDGLALGINVGGDAYQSELGSRRHESVSIGVEAFTTALDLRFNYRLPLSSTRTLVFQDPATSAAGTLLVENNRLIERRAGLRIEEVPLRGFSGEIGYRLPIAGDISLRASAGGFRYDDDDADDDYHGLRGGLELDIGHRDRMRFSVGAELQDDNRYGSHVTGMLRLTIPFGGSGRSRTQAQPSLVRQMGESVRRDYAAPSGTRRTDLTARSFAVDPRTNVAYGGIFFVNGSGTAGAAGTAAAPTSLADAVTRAGQNGVVVALGNAGAINTPGVTLATNQYLVGGASSIDVRRTDGSVVQFGFGLTNGTIVGTASAAAATVTQLATQLAVLPQIVAPGFDRLTGTAGHSGGAATARSAMEAIVTSDRAAAATVEAHVDTGGRLAVRHQTADTQSGDETLRLTADIASLTPLAITDPTIALGQGATIRDLTIRGGGVGVAANGIGGFRLERVTIENTGGVGLLLTNTLGAVAIEGLTVRGAAGAAVRINGGNTISLRNSTLGGGAGAIDIDDNGATLAVALSNLTLSATNGNVLDIDGSGPGTVTVTGLTGITIGGGNGETGGFAARSVAFDSDLGTAGTQTVDGGRMQIGSGAQRVRGNGFSLNDATGGLGFASLDIANTSGTGMLVQNAKTNAFQLTTLGGNVDTTLGTALNLDPLEIDLVLANVSSVNAGGPGVILSGITGSGIGGRALQIGTLTVSGSGQQGLLIGGGSSGLVVIGGGIIQNSSGAAVQVGAQGTTGSGGGVNLDFAAAISETGAGPVLALFEVGGALTFTGPITGSGGIVIDGTLTGSRVTIAGPSLSGVAGNAMALNGIAGTVTFAGTTTIANPGGDGIVVGAVPGTLVFGDVDITGLGGRTGLDLRTAQGNVIFNTLDISGTNAAGSTGISLAGGTNAGSVIVSQPSTITGVATGVDITNAAITGSFRFGDGNAANGLNSAISAGTPILFAGLDPTRGTYNFVDVSLTGDTSNLTGAGVSAYYVKAGANGAGTVIDPGSLAGAEAATAQYIVLLNDPAGGQDTLDAIGAGGSFDLDTGQKLISFLNQDFFAVMGAGLPTNLLVSGLGPTGITNPFTGSGAPILTTSGAGATVNLASNASLDGLIIRNGGGGVGVVGSNIAGVSIANSQISGSNGAIAITDGGGTASALLSQLALGAANGTVLSLSGAGTGTLSISGSGITISGTGTAAALSVVDVAIGALSFGTISGGASAGDAVQLVGLTGGPLQTGAITVAGAVSLVNNAAAIDLGTVSVTSAVGNAITLTGNSGALRLGLLNLTGFANTGLVIDASSNVSIAGATIAGGQSGLAVSALASGSVTLGALTVGNSSGSGLTLTNIDGTLSFTGTTTISNPGTAGIVFGSGSAGTISFGDVDIAGLGANRTGVDARNASGTIVFNTLDIAATSTAGTRGIDLTGASFAGSVTTTDSGTISGVGVGVDLTNAAITGTFRYGDGLSSDADGAASTINAVTPIVITGLNAGQGTYNFADVNLVGNTGSLETSATVYYAIAGGTGDGSRNNPGSILGAEASGAQYIVLLNNPAGGQDVIDALLAGGSMDLDAGQSLLSFREQDSFTLPGGVPNNVLLFGITTGISNPFAGSGAPILTTTAPAGFNTVQLAGNNLLDGLIIRNGGNGAGVFGTGLTGASSLRNSAISGAAGAIDIRDGATSSSLAMSNLVLSASGGNILNLLGTGAGSLTVTSFSGLTLLGGNGESGGAVIEDVTFDADTGTAGAQMVAAGALMGGTTGARIGGAGVSLTNVNGELHFADLDIANTGGRGLWLANTGANNFALTTQDGSINTTNGTGLEVNAATLAATLTSVTSSNGGFGILLNGTQGSFSVGSVSTSGVTVYAARILDASGTVSLGTLTAAAPDTFGGVLNIENSIAGNLDVRISGGSGVGRGNPPVSISNYGSGVLNLDVTLSSLSTAAPSGRGIRIDNNAGGSITGSVDIAGGSLIGTIDVLYALNTAVDLSYGGSITANSGNSVDVSGTSGAIVVSGPISDAGDGVVVSNLLGGGSVALTGSSTFTGSEGINISNVASGAAVGISATTITNVTGAGITLANIDGTLSFTGTTTISNPGTAGIVFGSGSAGTISFGDVDIAGLGANRTGLDARNASGTIVFNTLDIAATSTAGTRGIDLTGASFAGSVTTTDSGTISGVGVGVDLTNAAITGTFRYGDGSSSDADGAASTINAVTPIVITGLNAGQGTYNLADVNLVGDTSSLRTSATIYYAIAGGSGDGSRSNPGSITGAEASGAQYIFLLNDDSDGADDTITVEGDGTFSLGGGQTLASFQRQDSVVLPGGAPANLALFGIDSAITNPFTGSGAPTLTTGTNGVAVVATASNSTVDGLLILNIFGTGLFGSGVTNVTVRNSDIYGEPAITFTDDSGNTSVALSGLELGGILGPAMSLTGGNAGAALTITNFSNLEVINNGGAGGIVISDAVFDADTATAGVQEVNGGNLKIGSSISRLVGIALNVGSSEGAVRFSDFDILNSNGVGLRITGSTGLTLTTLDGTIDTTDGAAAFINGATLDLNLATISSTNGTGAAVQFGGVIGAGTGARAANVGALTVSNAGVGLLVTGNSAGTFTFGAASSIAGSGTTGIQLGDAAANSGGTVGMAYGGSISHAAATPIIDIRNHSAGTLQFSGPITSTGGGISFTNADGTYQFTGTNSITNAATGIAVGNGSDGSFSFGTGTSIASNSGALLSASGGASAVTYSGGLTYTGSGNAVLVDGGHTGSVTLNTATLSVSGGTAVNLSDADGTYNLNGTTTVTGTGAGVVIGAGSSGTLSAAAGASLTSSAGSLLSITGGTANVNYAGGMSYTGTGNALAFSGAHTGTVAFTSGTLSVTSGRAFNFSDADGTYNFNGTTAVNTASTNGAVAISTGSAATIGFGPAASINSTGGSALSVAGGTASVTYAGSMTHSGTANAGGISVTTGHTGSITFTAGSTLTTSGSTTNGLEFNNADGIYTFNGTTTMNGAGGMRLQGGSDGTFSFGTGTSIANPAFGGIFVNASAPTFTYNGTITLNNLATAVDIRRTTAGSLGTYVFNGAVTQNGQGPLISVLGAATTTAGSFAFNGALSGSGGIVLTNLPAPVTFTATGPSLTNLEGSAIQLNNIDGAVTFTGTTTINNPGGTTANSAAILFGTGSTGTITFGDVDITGLAATMTGVNARAAGGTVAFNTLDISGGSATGTRGVDLTGAAFSGNFRTTESGTITGVGIGVDLTNAAISGNFRYGDGSNADPDGAASTINATTPIVITGVNSSQGSYNFADVNLIGDTGNLAVNAYYVTATGTGNGTRNNPGSIANASASGATYIVLLDTSGAAGQDVINASSAPGGSLSLNSGQNLLSFANSDTFNVTGGAPANIVLFGVTGNTIANPNAGSGAPVLTTTTFASPTVVAGGNNIIDGVVIQNGGGSVGVFASNATGTLTIRNSTISGPQGAIRIEDGAATTTVALNNLILSSSGGDVLRLLGNVGSGSLTVSALSGLTINGTGAETAGAVINTVTFDSDAATAGTQVVNAGAATIGTTANRVSGAGLSLTNVTGALTFADLDIANQNGTGLLVLNSKANSFALTTLDGSVDTVNGTAVNLDPLNIAMTLAAVTATGGDGVVLDTTTGNFTVTGAVTVTDALNAGLRIEDASGAVTIGTLNVSNPVGLGSGLRIAQAANVPLTVSISGGSISSSNGAPIDILQTGANTTTLNVTLANVSSSATVGRGIRLERTAGSLTGSFSAAAGNITASIDGVFMLGGNYNFSYGGNITTGGTANSVDIANRSGGTVAFSGNITDNGSGISLQNNTGGSYTFSGGTKTLNTGNNTALTIVGNGIGTAFAFTGGGLDIDTAAGNGLLASANGTVTITGTGNTIDVGTGTAINLGAITIGAAGITFDTVNRTSGATPGLVFNNTQFAAGSSGIDLLGGTIAGSSATPLVQIATTAGDIFIGATLNNTGSGNVLSATSISGGTVEVAGNISSVNTGGGGIAVGGTAGTVILSGSSKILNTGSGAGILASGASGTFALQVTGGGLDIDTTGGHGIDWSTGGTLTVSGAGNTITTTGAGNGLHSQAGNAVINVTADIAGSGSGFGVNASNRAGGSLTTAGAVAATGAAGGVQIVGGSETVNIGSLITINSSGRAVSVGGRTGGAVTFSGNLDVNSGTGVLLSGNSGGSTTFSAGSKDISTGPNAALTIGNNSGHSVNFTNGGLMLTTTSGTGLSIVSGGTTTISGSGNTITTTTGTLVDVSNATAATQTLNAAFQSASNGASAVNGILVNNSSTGAITGTLNIAGGSITAGTRGVDMNGDSLDLTYGGSITASGGASRSIEITGRTGGTATFSGAIADASLGINLSGNQGGTIAISGTINAGGGTTAPLSIANNSGGTINLSGASKLFSTGASTAVSLSNNTGSTVNFTGGGLAINTTTGTGFNATGGGTATVQGTGNTIASSSGTALNVNGVTIGAGGLTFQSISSNGAANGIVLANAGTGGLTVTGADGGDAGTEPDAGTGGTITNTTSDGVSLTNASNVSLGGMIISNTGRHGVNMSGGNNLTLIGTQVINAGNADEEHGLNVLDTTGTVTLNRVTFNGAAEELVRIQTTGNLTLNVINQSAFSFPTTIGATAGNAFELAPSGSGSINTTIQDSTFTNIRGDSVNLGAITAGATGTQRLTFNNNTVTVTLAGRASGIAISGQEATTTFVTINGNSFTGAGGNGVINIDTNDSSVTNSYITNNVISAPPGIGINVQVDEGATARAQITGNTIANSGGDSIIVVNFGGVGVSTLDAIIRNNIVNGNGLNNAQAFAGGITISSFEDNTRIALSGNTVTGTVAGPNSRTDYYIEEVAGTITFEEVPNTAATTLDANYLRSINVDPDGGGPGQASVTIFGTIDLTNGTVIPSPPL